jgi:hypothetical protein
MTILWLLLLILGCAQPPQTDTYKLIILAGQSNAVGYGACADQFEPLPQDQDILFWWRVGDPPSDPQDSQSTGWTHLQPQHKGTPFPDGWRQFGNFSCNAGGFGPEISLARSLVQAGNQIAVLKVAYNGTSFAQNDWTAQGDSRETLRNEFHRATQVAQTEGILLEPMAFVWIQGECDAIDDDAARDYAENMIDLIHFMRMATGDMHLPVVITANSKAGSAQQQVVMHKERKYAASQDDDVIYVRAHMPHHEVDGIHFGAYGQRVLGHKIAYALLKLESRWIDAILLSLSPP